jgi:hypothetical protein
MTEEQRRYGLLNRIVLAHMWAWLNQHVENKDADMPDICYKLKSAGFASRAINGFDEQEINMLDDLSKDEKFIPIKDKEISLVIMALEVMKYHVENTEPALRTPKINISDRKLKLGKAAYTMDMLEAKKTAPDVYKRQKEIIGSTAEHAKVWYDFIKDYIMSYNFNREK